MNGQYFCLLALMVLGFSNIFKIEIQVKKLMVLFYPKKSGGRLDSIFCCWFYFLRSIKNATTAIAATIAIVEPARYVSVIGAGVGSVGGVAAGASTTPK